VLDVKRRLRRAIDQNPAMLIAGNWKMHKGPGATRAFFAGFTPPDGVDVVVCPQFGALGAAVETGHAIYAQNVHWADEGAFTGEVSPLTLLELGVRGSIVGHSERRQLFGESDETVARRTSAALAHGLGVIACVGESAEERAAGQTEFVLRLQVDALADSVGPHSNLVVAYEPIWAIGTGDTATAEQAQNAHAFIKSRLTVPVLYGGSVKPENARELLAQPDVDGALVGGASLEVEFFTAICQTAASLS
jgi:triosephosphate isomerase (TIM)